MMACGDDDSGNGGDSGNDWNTADATSSSDAGGTSDTQPPPSDTSSGGGWDTASADTAASSDAASSDTAGPDPGTPPPNTQVNLGGAQDFGFFRAVVESGQVPNPEDMDAGGFFAEHHTPLPDPVCGEKICLQAMLGQMGNLMTGANCTLIQVGLNSTTVVDPNDRPPLNLVVVVDLSGSMNNGNKIDFVRDGLHKLVNELSDVDHLSIVTYATTVDVPFDMQAVKNNRNELHDLVSSLSTGGSTNLHDGLEEGFQVAMDAYDSGRQNRVILLSDGVPTVGITNTDEILEMSAGYNSDGIGLTTVGLGTDFSVDVMRGLAEQADGNFYFLENSAAVDEVFTEELAYFTVPVAFDVRLDVHAGNHYTFGAAHGSHLFKTNEEGGTLSVPSVFLAHRLAHDDVTDGDGRRGGGSALLLELMPMADDGSNLTVGHVATVSLEFREPGSNEIVTEEITIDYPRAPWETLVTGFFDNAIVTKSFVMLNIYASLEEACRLHHDGQPLEAMNLLLRVIAAASDYEDDANDGEGDIDIQLDIELMEDLVGVIEDVSGINEEPEPIIPEDPWPND